MKDEEMAGEYAKPFYNMTRYDYVEERTHVKEAFLAGLKAGRPQWHDLRKDKNDLPKKVCDYVTNIGVLTYDNYGNGVHKWHTPYCEACDYADVVGDDEVIAWCEIPQFKELDK